MIKYQIFGNRSDEVSQREKQHQQLARRAAAEGMVLLKNEGVLPLKADKIMLYGPGSRRTVKGGSGSGDVHERHSVSIEEGLLNAGFKFPSTLWMDRFEKKYQEDMSAWKEEVDSLIKGYTPFQTMQMFTVIVEHPAPYPACTPVMADELSDESDTAVYVLARQDGEGQDRRVEKGSYLLSDVETESLIKLAEHYRKLILVLNCGGVIDLSILDKVRIDAVIMYGQCGMEGGNALADILTGKVNPSGRLTDTWAKSYWDYPGANTFGYLNNNLESDAYDEGPMVGHRWFDHNKIAPRYPFGYGLSYTEFTIDEFHAEKDMVECTVTNKGTTAGKEVVQVYIEHHGKRDLAGFRKTGLLKPGESETLTVSIELENIAEYDENKKQFFNEKGIYEITVNGGKAGSFVLDEEITYDTGHYETSPQLSAKTLKILDKLSDYDKIDLVTGGGYAVRAYNNVMGAAGRTNTRMLKKGIPNIILADGPAGINVNPSMTIGKDGLPRYPEGLPENWKWGWLKRVERLMSLGKNGITVYHYMTAWPNETTLAQSWDTELLEEIGKAVGREMLETGISVWLAPGMNIHRNPLCGRNFEYYSEDPLISGKMAAAITRGVQSQGGVGVTVKHFCCNNQEDNRVYVSAEVSMKALQEIYLRGFRIAVRESHPWAVMTSYNKVNGTHVCNSELLCTEILRNDLGFKGLVMTDWNATNQCSHLQAINAGNDLIMPGDKNVRDALRKGLKDGSLNKNRLNESAGRVLELVFKSEVNKDFGR